MPSTIRGDDNFDSAIASLINNSAAISDLSLLVGQSAYLDFSGVTSLPLHIATGDNQLYEMIVSTTNESTYSGAVALQPNNTTYASAITNQIISAQGTSVAAAATTQSTFTISSANGMEMSRHLINTSTNKKRILTNDISESATLYYTGQVGSRWSDTTTVWASLGTLTFSVAMTGRVLIRRLM